MDNNEDTRIGRRREALHKKNREPVYRGDCNYLEVVDQDGDTFEFWKCHGDDFTWAYRFCWDTNRIDPGVYSGVVLDRDVTTLIRAIRTAVDSDDDITTNVGNLFVRGRNIGYRGPYPNMVVHVGLAALTYMQHRLWYSLDDKPTYKAAEKDLRTVPARH